MRALTNGPIRALLGTETEYAVTALDHHGQVLSPEDVSNRILGRAAQRPSLSGSESGLFLENGGRFYIDAGCHPEYASPETLNPWDAVRFALAGDRLMTQLANEVSRDPDVASIIVRKGNVDYAGPATFASHENYLHRRHPQEIRPALVPHLVSRLVMTGGGGFHPFDRARARFLLAPRAMFVQPLMRPSVLRGAALVDDRAQPHCTGFHRQHLTCGDANRSHLSLLLRLGTTALVVGLIDSGCEDDVEVKLAEPSRALATVAGDLTLRQPLELASGRQATAVEIQRHYLRRARRNRACLPVWTDALCDVWEDVLDRLAGGPDAVADRLDWAIKHALFRDRAARRRARGRAAAGSPMGPRPMAPRSVGSRWRAELCEVDFRFGQIYPPGLFDALDAAGVLQHRVPNVDQIELAMSGPPAEGRARIRGEATRRLADQAVGIVCGWDGIRDTMSARVLDLASPFADQEVWRDSSQELPSAASLVTRLVLLATGRPSAAVTRAARALHERLGACIVEHGAIGLAGANAILLNDHAVLLRKAGRLDDAEWLMRSALAIDVALGEASRHKLPHRRNNLGTLFLLQGRAALAREEVTRAWALSGSRHDLTSARVLTIRLIIAMVEGEPGDLYLGQLKSHLVVQPLPDFADVDPRWPIAGMLETLGPALDAEARDLLSAIGDVINGDRSFESLDGILRWRRTLPVPLDVPWPGPVHT